MLCTEVSLIAILPKGITWRRIDEKESSLHGSAFSRDIGSITADSDISVEYGIVDPKNSEEFIKSHKKIPVQFQIKYTKRDKSKYVRVITSALDATQDRNVAELNCNLSVIGLNAVQQSAKMAQAGEFLMARNNLLGVTKFSQRIAKTDVQMEEYANFITMSEDLDTTLMNLQSKKGVLDDNTVKTLQRMKTVNLILFLAGSKKNDIIAKRKKHTKSAMKSVH